MNDNNENDQQHKLNVDSNSDTKRQKIIKEVRSIVLIVFFVLVFRSICFEPFRIPTGSMIPNLMIGDFILVETDNNLKLL